MRRAAHWTCLLLLILAGSGCGGRETTTPASSESPKPTASAMTKPAMPARNGPYWETYHGSPSLEGSADVALPDSLAPLWRVVVGDAIVNPAVSGKDRICVADTKGNLYALNWKGDKVWTKSYTLPSGTSRRLVPASFEAPLALFESTLIACASSGAIYALDVTNGDERWASDIGLPILGAPSFGHVTEAGKTYDRLFVIDQSEGALHSLDFDSGNKVWASEGVGRCDGSPSVSDAWTVFGSCACAIHVFKTGDKAMVHEIPLDEESQVAGGVVISGDSLFSGSRSGKFVHADARTGTILWTNTECEGESFATPAVDGDWVLFTADDHMIYALDRLTGNLKWKQKLKSVPSSPIIVRDKVLVSAGGTLYLLRLSNGETLWSYAVSDEISSPALAGNLVVVGSDDGTVTAFGAKHAE